MYEYCIIYYICIIYKYCMYQFRGGPQGQKHNSTCKLMVNFCIFFKNVFSGLLLFVMSYAFSLHFLFVSVFINYAVILRKVTGLKLIKLNSILFLCLSGPL